MLIEKLSGEFEAEVRSRGGRYFKDGRVRRLRIDEGGITAQVRGTDDYEVTIDVETGHGQWRIYTSCECPYGADSDGLCKHVWATLLAAEARGLAPLGRVPATVRLVPGEEEYRVLTNGSWSVGTLRRAPVKPPPVPGWKRLIERAPVMYARAPIPGPGVGAVRYVLDVTRSRDRGAVAITTWLEPEAGAPPRRSRPRRLTLSPSRVGMLTDPQDRVICGMLVGAAKAAPDYGYHSWGHSTEQGAAIWYANSGMLPVLLPLLRDSGRWYWAPSDKEDHQPIREDAGPPWELALSIEEGARPKSGKSDFFLRGALRRDGRRIPLDAPELLAYGEPGLMLHGGVLCGFEAHGCFQWVTALRAEGDYAVKRGDLPGLLTELGQRGLRVPVEWPSSWGVREAADAKPLPRLTLSAKRGAVESVAAELGFKYGSMVVGEQARGTYAWDGGPGKIESDLVRRAVEAENRLAARLAELGANTRTYSGGREIAVKKVPRLVAALLSEGWEVLGDKALYRSPGEFKIEVASGIDWFDLDGHVDFGGVPATVAEILAAARKGEQFVTLGDGSLGVLPEEWLARHGKWLRLGRVEDGKVRFSKAQLTLIDALLAEMPEATCDAQVAAARGRLAAFDGIAARPEAGAFQGTLRPYQREGLGWLHFLNEFGFGGCLADDMGLGKTVQLLAHLADRRAAGEREPWLVVAPKSLVFNWAREAERFIPGVRVLDFTGVGRRERAGALAASDLVLTTYGTLRKDVESLREVEFGCIVLDEAQAIKNANSQGAKAARLLRGRRRLAMTGTPVENRLGDLWSIFEFLNPGMLGGSAAFGEAVRGRDGGQDLGLLRRALAPFILRRTKDKVAPELPARSEQTILCEMEPGQREFYEGLRRAYRAELMGRIDKSGLGKSKVHVLEALLRLRQASCHPGLIDPSLAPAGSAKLAELMDRLEELGQEGHRALVFSQFTTFLALVRKELDGRGTEYEYLDGQTPAKERERSVDRFQGDGGRGVFLISLKAGGVGLNLTAADYVFLLDPWWNPAVEAQAIDRTHRIGQDKKVMAYRLIAKGTVEERILELQKSKRELAEAIVSAREGPLSSLTREDLEWLLS